MRLDLAHRHVAGIQRKDLVVEARPAGLVLLDDLRIEGAMPVARYLDGQFTELALEFLLAETVAGVAHPIADRLMLVVAQVVGQLGIQRTLDQLLGQLLEDAVGTDQVFRLLIIGQKLIQQFVGNGVGRLVHGVSSSQRQCRS